MQQRKGKISSMYVDRIESLTGRQSEILGHENMKKFGVLLPVVRYQGEECILFEKRSINIIQPGEICFPGGSFESDDKEILATVIRETHEELGLQPENIKIVAPLDIMVLFNIIIYPFVGIIADGGKIEPNKNEVETVLYIPIKDLMAIKPLKKEMEVKPVIPEDYPFHLIPNGKSYPFRKGKLIHYFYIWQDTVIWGITARILKHFLQLIKPV